MYTFKYTLTEADYFAFLKFHVSNSPASKKSILGLQLLLPAVFLALFLKDLFFGTHQDFPLQMTQIVFFTIVSVVWFFVCKPFHMWVVRLHLKAIRKEGKLFYNQESVIQFDETFFVGITNNSETKANYVTIERIAVGKGAIYIYLGAVQAVTIPFSVFETEAQRNEFLAFLNLKVMKNR